MHSKGIAHRDLKLDNIIVIEESQEECSFKIKIIDFGFCVTTERL